MLNQHLFSIILDDRFSNQQFIFNLSISVVHFIKTRTNWFDPDMIAFYYSTTIQ